MDDLEEIYENFIDHIINDYPLTTSRFSEFDDAININQQIVNRISNIRRYLETNDQENDYQEDNNQENNYQEEEEGIYHPDDYAVRSYIGNQSNEGYDITASDTFDGDVINTIFEYLLNNTLSTSSFTDLNDLDDVKVTLTKEQFNKFEKKNILEIENIENIKNCNVNCSICMDNYDEKEQVVLLKCNHYYHENCIENWLCNQKVTCPICRKDTREML